MVSAQIIISIHYLKLDKETELELINGIFITNKSSVISNIINSDQLKNAIGLNEVNSILENETIIYLNKVFDDSSAKFNEYNYLLTVLEIAEFFLLSLWLIKDNSVKSELGHLIYSSNKGLFIHTNHIHTASTNKLGLFETETFSRSELLEALSFFPVFIVTMTHNDLHANPSVKLTTRTSRLTRAIYFLQSARESTDIGTKLAHFCSVLESLFSVSTSELRHRLSETVALFLGKNKEEKINIYQVLLNSYDIRSSIVHGDGVSLKYTKNNNNLLINTMNSTDIIVRNSLRTIIESKDLYELFTEKSKDDVAVFNQSLLF